MLCVWGDVGKGNIEVYGLRRENIGHVFIRVIFIACRIAQEKHFSNFICSVK